MVLLRKTSYSSEKSSVIFSISGVIVKLFSKPSCFALLKKDFRANVGTIVLSYGRNMGYSEFSVTIDSIFCPFAKCLRLILIYYTGETRNVSSSSSFSNSYNVEGSRLYSKRYSLSSSFGYAGIYIFDILKDRCSSILPKALPKKRYVSKMIRKHENFTSSILACPVLLIIVSFHIDSELNRESLLELCEV